MPTSLHKALPLALMLVVGCEDAYVVRPDQPTVRRYGQELVTGTYVSPTAYEQYIVAMLAENAGRLDEAVEALRHALGSDGTSAYLRWKLADALLSTGRVDEARDELATALQLEPDAAEAYVVKARLRARMGDRSGVLAAAQKAVELDPTLEEAYLVLATAYHDGGDDARSLATMRSLAAHVPSANAEEALGRAALKARDRQSARAHLTRALELDSSRVEVRLELARTLLGDGDADQGLALLATAAERTRDSAVAMELARAAAAAGHRAQALAVLDRLDEDAHTQQARLDVGLGFIAIGVPQRAVAIGRSLVAEQKRSERRSAAWSLIGRASEADGALAESLAAWQEVMPLDPEYTDAVMARARLLQDRGRHAEALALLETAIADRQTRDRLDERDQLAVARASLRTLLGDRTQAVAQLATLASKRPRSLALRLGWAKLARPDEVAAILAPVVPRGDVRVELALAHALVQTGKQLDDAQRLLERVEGSAPHDADVAAGLAEVYAARGRSDDAQRLLERADRLRPNDVDVLAQLAALYGKTDRVRALDAITRALAAHPVEQQREALEAQRLQLQNGRMGAR